MGPALDQRENLLRIVLRVYTATFAIAGLAFLIAPVLVLAFVDRSSVHLGLAASGAIGSGAEWFWSILAAAMMAAITVACGLAAADVRRNRALVWPVLASKLTSSIGGIAAFLLLGRHLAHLTIATTDFPLFVLLLWAHRRAPVPVN